jgi:anti-anti-sigma regulatory factor
MISVHTSTSNGEPAHIAYELIEEQNPKVVLIEFLSQTIADPTLAAQLGQQLGSLVRPDLPKQFVIDFTKVKTFSSTSFGALVSFILKVREAGGRVKICNMDDFVRFGADVIRMGDFSEFASDRKTAIEEFIKS